MPQCFGVIETPKPRLVIQADGTVLRSGKVAAEKMSADELKKLLTFIVVENRFFEFDQAAVDTAIRKGNAEFDEEQEKLSDAQGGIVEGRMLPDDMASTVITVDLGDRKMKVELYGYGFLAGWHPRVEAIQQIHRVEQRLTSLAD